MRVKHGPESLQMAGIPFKQQPVCEVVDIAGNLLTVHDYQVTLRVINGRGAGCLCDLLKGNECITALASPTIQQCATGTFLVCLSARLCVGSVHICRTVHLCNLRLKLDLMQVNVRFLNFPRRVPRSKKPFSGKRNGTALRVPRHPAVPNATHFCDTPLPSRACIHLAWQQYLPTALPWIAHR